MHLTTVLGARVPGFRAPRFGRRWSSETLRARARSPQGPAPPTRAPQATHRGRGRGHRARRCSCGEAPSQTLERDASGQAVHGNHLLNIAGTPPSPSFTIPERSPIMSAKNARKQEPHSTLTFRTSQNTLSVGRTGKEGVRTSTWVCEAGRT